MTRGFSSGSGAGKCAECQVVAGFEGRGVMLIVMERPLRLGNGLWEQSNNLATEPGVDWFAAGPLADHQPKRGGISSQGLPLAELARDDAHTIDA